MRSRESGSEPTTPAPARSVRDNALHHLGGLASRVVSIRPARLDATDDVHASTLRRPGGLPTATSHPARRGCHRSLPRSGWMTIMDTARRSGPCSPRPKPWGMRPSFLRAVGLVALLAAGSGSGCTCRSEDGARSEPRAQQKTPAGRDGAATSSCPAGMVALAGSTRPAALAGSWYPGDATQLSTAVDGYLSRAKPPATAAPIALISPHAGYRFSGQVAAHGYRALAGHSYRRVFLIGPAHRAAVSR